MLLDVGGDVDERDRLRSRGVEGGLALVDGKERAGLRHVVWHGTREGRGSQVRW